MPKICCKEINEYLFYYENHKDLFNEERKLLIENIVKPTLNRDDVYFDAEDYYNCLNFCKLWFYEFFPYQKFVTAFMFMYSNNVPIFKTFIIMMGRGNGKDGWIIPVALYFTSELYGIPNYNVDIIATSESQARDSFLVAYDMLEHNKAKMFQHFYWNKTELYNRRTLSRFRFLTSNSKTSDGKKPGMVIMNEYHAYLDAEAANTNTSGLGKKMHSRAVIITSDGLIRGGPLDELKSTCRLILNGEPNHIKYFPFICKMDSEELVNNPKYWVQANPSIEYMPELKNVIETDWYEQKLIPSKRSEFLAKRMNLPQQDKENCVLDWEFIAKASYKDPDKLIERDCPNLDGKKAIVGIDFASLNDFASVGLLFKVNEEYIWRQKTFISSKNKFFKDIKFPFENYGQPGFNDYEIVDSVIDEDLIVNYVLQQMSKYQIKKIILDNYRFMLLRKAFENKGIVDIESKNNPDGLIRMIRYPASIAAIIAPKVEKEFLLGNVNIGNSSLMRWAINNTSIKEGKDGNKKYEKIEPKLRKNDPFMAFIAAFSASEMLEEKFIYV